MANGCDRPGRGSARGAAGAAAGQRAVATRTPASLAAAVLAAGLLALAPAGRAQGQDPPAPVLVNAPSPGERLAERRAAVATEQARAVADREAAVAAGDEELVAHLDALIEALAGLDLQLGTQAVAMERSTLLAAQVEDAAQRLAGPPDAVPTHPRLAESDVVRDAIDANGAALTAAEDIIRRADQQLASAREGLEARKRAAAAARDDVAGAPDPVALVEQQRRVRLAEVAVRQAEATVEVRRLELENLRALARSDELERQLLERQLALIEARLVVTEDDLEPPHERIAQRQRELGRELDSAGSVAAVTQRLEEEARAQHMEAGAPGSGPLAMQLDARRVENLVAKERVRLLTEHQARIRGDLEVWRRRIQVLSGEAATADMRAWAGELANQVQQLEFDDRTLAREQASNLSQLEVLRTELAGLAGGPGTEWLETRLRERTALGGLYTAERQDVARALALRRRVLGEIDARTTAHGLGDLAQQLLDGAAAAWDYEIYPVSGRDGERIPITPRKIVTAILIFIVGLVLAKVSRRFLRLRLLPRFQLGPGVSTIYETLVFYLLFVTAFLLALQVLEIPLTAFTVLGGAVAIGVGFGSQNLINNFISGLIIMAERPIRVGDLIEVDKTYGIVERIGARSTTVLTSDNINIVIPNSSFLQNNVVNWTLSNDVIRTKVVVGVAYGSPTRDVDRMLRRAVVEHGKVLEHPEPIVVFADFGDNALVFEVYFWIRARTTMERRRVESDIRSRIDNLFRDAGITIAFPQRDVHFDPDRPVAVRMVREVSPATPPAGEADTPAGGGRPPGERRGG